MLLLMLLTYYGYFCQRIYGVVGSGSGGGILYPRESETREVKSLDGIWNFKLSPKSDSVQAYKEKWFSKELKESGGTTIPMPVPASYNDITTFKEIRDFIGVVWYDRKFFVPGSWSENQRIWLRFGSVCYSTMVVSNNNFSFFLLTVYY